MPRRFAQRSGLSVGLLSVAMFATACGGSDESAVVTTAAPAAGVETTADPALALPDLTVPTADGGQIEWTSLENQDVVLWFWAPW